MSKYHAIKTVVDNVTFDSKREAARYNELKILLNSKQIANLQLQVPFKIEVNGKLICKYIADFQYTDLTTGQQVVEDVKGVKTPVFKLKSKLVEAIYNIKIVEVA